MKVMFAILVSFKFIKDSIWKWPETLRTPIKMILTHVIQESITQFIENKQRKDVWRMHFMEENFFKSEILKIELKKKNGTCDTFILSIHYKVTASYFQQKLSNSCSTCTYTKHCGCHSSPCELTIFSCATKPSLHREQYIWSSDISVTLYIIYKCKFQMSVINLIVK